MDRSKKLRLLWDPFVHPMISTYSAAVSFHLLMSSLPAAVLLISLLPYLSPLILTSVKIIGVPSTIISLLRYMTERSLSAGTSLTISLSAVFTIWSASRGILSLLDGINASMHTKRLTGFFRRRVVAAFYFLFLGIALLLSLLVLIFGDTLLSFVLQYDSAPIKVITTIFRLRGVVTTLLLGTLFSLMYRVLPSVKRPFRLCVQSGYFSASAWVVFSIAFSIYVDNFSNFPKLYGSIGGIALTALWLRICVTVLLEGAVLIRVRHEEDYHPIAILRSILS